MGSTITQRITPFLWFDNQAEDAMNFYVSIFPNSKTGLVTRYGETGPADLAKLKQAYDRN